MASSSDARATRLTERNHSAFKKSGPLASAWVVVDAMVPATASVASASAAILVLIDMTNSIRLRAARCGPHIQLDGASPDPVRIPARNSLFSYSIVITDG